MAKKARARSSAPHISVTAAGRVRWAKQRNKVSLTPLKAIVQAHVDHLENLPEKNAQVRKTLAALKKTSRELSTICGLSMEVPTKP